MCKIYYYVWNVSYTASIIILTVIAAERYIAIIHPLKSRNFLTHTKVKVVQFVIWITALMYNIPYLFLYDTISLEQFDKEFCYPDFANLSGLKVLSLLNLIVWYVLPLTLIGFMYYRVGIALWKTTVVSALRLQLQVDTEETSFRSNATRQSQINRDSFNRYSNTNNRSRASTFKITEQGNSSNSTGSQDSHCSENAVLYARNETTKDIVFSTKKCEYTDCHDFDSVDDVNYNIDQSCQRSRNQLFIKNKSSFNSKQSMRYRETIVSSSRRVSRARKKVIRLLVCVVVTFGICVLPHMMKVMNHFWGLIKLPQSIDVIISPVSFIILYLNSVMNPILYALFSKNFRRSFKEVSPCFRSKFSKR